MRTIETSQSSWVKDVRYSRRSKTLYLTLNSVAYRVLNFPRRWRDRLAGVAARGESVGAFYNQHIKSNFVVEPV